MQLQAVNQLHDTVMLQSDTVGQNADSSFLAGGQASNRKQHQILLWLQACVARCNVTFVQKQADQEAKFGEGGVLGVGNRGDHKNILSYSDIILQGWELQAGGYRSEFLAKRFLRFVMVVSVFLIKMVGSFG